MIWPINFFGPGNPGQNILTIISCLGSYRIIGVTKCPVVGPAALDMAWIGAGSADVFFHFGIHCWDMAAGLKSFDIFSRMSKWLFEYYLTLFGHF